MFQWVKSIFKRHLSAESLDKLRYGRNFVISLCYAGMNRECPVCRGKFRRFLPHGLSNRQNAACPRCGSLERHRLIWLYLRDKTDFFSSNLKVLHFAPEFCFQRIFRSLPNLDYVSADLTSNEAMERMDITNIPVKNDTYDCILCCHVLEHIPDDMKALKELYRVAKPKGWAIIHVPIKGEKTFEDLSVKSPEERLKHYGQEDHFQIYGSDFLEKLQSVGFRVKVGSYLAELDEKRIEYHGLVVEGETKEKIYFCSKAKEN